MQLRKVLITGATKGLGKEIAKVFLKNGDHVGINYSQDDHAFEEFYNQYPQEKILKLKIDVGSKQDVKKMFDIIKEKWGSLDVLINNAGIGGDKNFLVDMAQENYDKVLQTNLFGSIYCLKEAIPLMKQKGGYIINISSILGIKGGYGCCGYAASKAAIVGYSKAMAKELGQDNIKVNVVLPGFMETEMTKQVSPLIKQKVIEQSALKKLSDSKLSAQFIFELCNKEQISGQVFNLDSRIYEFF